MGSTHHGGVFRSRCPTLLQAGARARRSPLPLPWSAPQTLEGGVRVYNIYYLYLCPSCFPSAPSAPIPPWGAHRCSNHWHRAACNVCVCNLYLIAFTVLCALPRLTLSLSLSLSFFYLFYTPTTTTSVLPLVAPAALLSIHVTARAVPSRHHLQTLTASGFTPTCTKVHKGSGCYNSLLLLTSPP